MECACPDDSACTVVCLTLSGPAANKKANGKRTAIAAPNARPVKQQQRQGGPPVTYSITPMGGAPLGQKQPAKNTPPSPAMQQASATAPTTGNQHSNRISKPKATQPTNAPAAKAPSKQATVASQKNAASVRDLEKARLTKVRLPRPIHSAERL